MSTNVTIVFHNTTPDLQDQDQDHNVQDQDHSAQDQDIFWSQTGLVLRPTVWDHITDNWSYEACKAPVISSPTNRNVEFYRLDHGCPSCRPTNSVEALKSKKYYIPRTCRLKAHLLTLGSSSIVFVYDRLLVTLWMIGCQATRRSSDPSTHLTN